MIIGKKIKKIGRHLNYVESNSDIVIGIGDVQRFRDKLGEDVFVEIGQGHSILPSSLFGPVSRFNILGKYVENRGEGLIKGYKILTNSYGNKTKVDHEYYPVTYYEPPNVKLQMAQIDSGEKLIVGPPFRHCEENEERTLHTINLFLEIFGECQILNQQLEPLIKTPVRNVDWEILLVGQQSRQRLDEVLSSLDKTVTAKDKSLRRERFEIIEKYEPEFIVFGRSSFRGYVVFAFPPKNLFLLESMFDGNATYVFTDDWEELSQLTKTEILGAQLHEIRLIHRQNWASEIEKLLK